MNGDGPKTPSGKHVFGSARAAYTPFVTKAEVARVPLAGGCRIERGNDAKTVLEWYIVVLDALLFWLRFLMAMTI